MKLSIKNLGIIKEGTIELQDITVIAGKNGVGKSTVGKMLYCIDHTFHKMNEKIRIEISNQILSEIFKRISYDSAPEMDSLLSAEVPNQIITHYQKTGEVQLPDRLKEYFRNNKVEEYIINRIQKILDIKPNEILESMLGRTINAEMGTMINSVNHPRRKVRVEFQCNNNNDILCFSKSSNNPPVIEKYSEVDRDALYIDDPDIVDSVSHLESSLIGVSRFSHKYDIVRRLRRDDQQDSVISAILAKESWKELESLINDMCLGKLTKTSSGKYSYSSDNYREPLSIESLSTGLKSILLLKTLIEKGELDDPVILIFDEPEVHLHPEWQFNLARILTLLPRVFDAKILISTHSSDFLSAIEYYSNINGINERTRYYQMKKNEDGYSVIDDVTDHIDTIYHELGRPFLSVADKI